MFNYSSHVKIIQTKSIFLKQNLELNFGFVWPLGRRILFCLILCFKQNQTKYFDACLFVDISDHWGEIKVWQPQNTRQGAFTRLETLYSQSTIIV